VKNYIPKKLLVITYDVNSDVYNDVLIDCLFKSFDWANRMGLEGKKVYDLTLKEPDRDNPLSTALTLWCKVECSEQERKDWEKNCEYQIKLAICEALIEDEKS